jgi:hypothetical protein
MQHAVLDLALEHLLARENGLLGRHLKHNPNPTIFISLLVSCLNIPFFSSFFLFCSLNTVASRILFVISPVVRFAGFLPELVG